MFFIKCGYPLLINDINNILVEKEKIQKETQNNNQIVSTNQNKKGGKGKFERKKTNTRQASITTDMIFTSLEIA